jgi:hypothetical protein
MDKLRTSRRIDEPTLNSTPIREHQDRKRALKHRILDLLTLPCKQVSGTARSRASCLSMRARPIDQTQRDHADPLVSHSRHLSQLLTPIQPHREAPRVRAPTDKQRMPADCGGQERGRPGAITKVQATRLAWRFWQILSLLEVLMFLKPHVLVREARICQSSRGCHHSCAAAS